MIPTSPAEGNPPATVAEGAIIDTFRPHPARRYNYWLGGKDHYAVDRESGDQIAEAFPTIRTAARENRRVVYRPAIDFYLGFCCRMGWLHGP